MKRGLLAVVVCALMGLPWNVEAQETGTVYLTVIGSHPLPADIQSEVYSIIQEVMSNLRSNSVKVISVKAVDRAIGNFIALDIRPRFDLTETSYQIDIQAFDFLLPLEPSPILRPFPHNGLPPYRVIFSSDDPTARNSAVNIATAFSLYVADRYELADLYFEKSSDGIDLLQTREYSADLPLIVSFYRGNCALIERDYATATRFYKAALLDDDNTLDIHSAINLAWTYLQLGDEEDAFELMSRSLSEAETDNADKVFVLTKRAQLYALVSRYNEAVADMDAAIEIWPESPSLYITRGQIYLLLYEWDKALADYNRAVELDPKYADAYFYRGVLFYTQGPRENALADFTTYLELAPQGDHAEEAARYVESIPAELEALNGD